MDSRRALIGVFLFSSFCACLQADDTLPSVTAPAVAEELPLPSLFPRTGTTGMWQVDARNFRRWLMFSGCRFAPLTDIRDPESQALEANADTAPANVEGMRPDAAQALDSFREMVSSLGGTFDLKSAYRPTAYQTHLHEVWVKWVKELRGNRTAGCGALREEVGAEFARHRLLFRQQPVIASDHELGIAFDASAALPRSARLKGKRVTVDKLAALVGIKRPMSRRDPVHFKVITDRAGSDIHPTNFH